MHGFHIDVATMKYALTEIFDDPHNGIIAKLTQVVHAFEKTGQSYYNIWSGESGPPATTQLPFINGTRIFGGPLGNNLGSSLVADSEGYQNALDDMIRTFDNAVTVFVKNQHGLIAALAHSGINWREQSTSTNTSTQTP